MKKILLFLSLCLFFFVGCKSIRYEKIIEDVNIKFSILGLKKIEDAEKVLKLLDKAIQMEPHRWDAYSKQVQIYSFWSHIPEDFADNQEGVKSVFDKWLENGNTFNQQQKLCYANTLYSLGDCEKARELHRQVYNWYLTNEIDFASNELDYFIYFFAGVLIGEVNINNFDEWKVDYYDGEFNDFLQDTIMQLNDPEKKDEIVQCYCIC